jgi:Mg2+ and Co2+ transporter CorA
MKRIKKATVKLEQGFDWLRRFESGESASKICDTDDYDVRTVRKHIERARLERESREARNAVMRNALELHYADMHNLAESWNSELRGLNQTSGSLDDDLIESALRQHLPRSPLWTYRSRFLAQNQKMVQQKQELASLIEPTVKTDVRIAALASSGLDQITISLIEALKFQSEQWAEGSAGLNVQSNLLCEPAGESEVKLRYGGRQFGAVDKKQSEKIMEVVRKVVVDMESFVRKSETFKDLEKTYNEIERTKEKLREELAIIRLRRIVPGRCKYCPL